MKYIKYLKRYRRGQITQLSQLFGTFNLDPSKPKIPDFSRLKRGSPGIEMRLFLMLNPTTADRTED